MTVILKIMSGELLHDSDPDKKFELIELGPNEKYELFDYAVQLYGQEGYADRYYNLQVCVGEAETRKVIRNIDRISNFNFYELNETHEIVRAYILNPAFKEFAIREENKKLWVK